MSEKNARHIRNYYQTFLGRAPDQGGFDGYMAQAAKGRSLSSIKKEIATSQEAKDNVIRAQQAQQQAAQATAAANAAQSQLAQYQRDLERYSNDLSNLQTQYNTALGQVSTWQSKAGEYQTQAADWESQFNKRTEEWETAQAEAQMYRDQAVGAQLRALRSGATSGGANQTQQTGTLTGGKNVGRMMDDKRLEVEKDIKAESGILSNKGPVVQKINTATRRQTGPQGAPSQGLARGNAQSNYYASRFS